MYSEKTRLQSYLSLNTSVLLAFLVAWNLAVLVAMYGFGPPITPESGIVITGASMLACVFSLSVALSENIRVKLLEPKRAQIYRGVNVSFRHGVAPHSSVLNNYNGS